MSVRCKFRCQWNDGKRIVLHPVYDPDPNSENGRFYQLTPSGSLDFCTVNESAAAQFEKGKEYYIDITRADAPQN